MINKVPTEILVKVFEYLTRIDLKENVSLTCRQWRIVVQDLLLVSNRVKVDFPFNYSFSKLLKVIEESPAFGRSIRSITMKDDHQYVGDKNFSFYFDSGVDKIHHIIEACSNLRELKIVFYEFGIGKILNHIFECENSLIKAQIKTLRLDFDYDSGFDGNSLWMIGRNFLPYYEDKFRRLDIAKLTNRTANTLDELIITNTVISGIRPLMFVKGSKEFSDNFFLTTIKIVCPQFGITKACLDFIFSDHLAALQNLDLCATLLDFNDGNGAFFAVDEDYSASGILKQFCLRKLKHYNIALQNVYGEEFFAFDNCKDVAERYSAKFIKSHEDVRYHFDYYNYEYVYDFEPYIP